jgi:hypothetical protein
MPNAYELYLGQFVRGLTNLKTQLAKAEEHAAAGGKGESALLGASLAGEGPERDVANAAGADLHLYTLAAHAHWASEGAMLAIAKLLGAPRSPAPCDAKTFADLHQRLDAAIAFLRETAPSDLEAGLGREIVIEHRRGSMRSNGGRFLVAFAIPHFFYHLTTAYGILRNQGVKLTMGDFLGNWGTD